MDHSEREEPREEFVVEVTNLDKVNDEESSSSSTYTRPRFLSSRYRKQRTLAIATFVGLALLTVLFTTVPLKRLFPPGVPAAGSSTYYFALDAKPPWGNLSVDGKRVALFARGSYTLFSLPRGQHTLTWRAAPFAPQQCRISVPVDFSSASCRFSDETPHLAVPISASIRFATNLNSLAPAQLVALLQLAQAELDRQRSSETVQVGEMYAQTEGNAGSSTGTCTVLQRAALCFAVAHQPLEATLHLQLFTGLSPAAPCADEACDSSNPACQLFCDLPAYLGSNRALPPTMWQASVLVHLLWQFTTSEGRVTEKNQADSFVLGQQNALAVLLNITWNGKQWAVTPTSQSDFTGSEAPVCAAAIGDMYTLVFASSPQNAEPQLAPGPTPASGCLIKIQPLSGSKGVSTSTPPSASPTAAYVLQRFGVLLAVNTTAHRLWPFLPLAGTYARHIAQQLVTQGAIGH
jgi:hypothetical protein